MEGEMDTNLNIDLTLSSTEEENKLEIAGNCSHEAGQKHALYVTTISSLPDDVMFDILVRLPARDIYDSARLVCSSWLKIIRTRYFYRAHFQQSTWGLLIYHKGLEYHRPVSISTQKDQIEISYFKHKFIGRRVSSSCNGLVVNYLRLPNELHISNPATKRHFALPPFPAERQPPFGSAAIAYAAASMEYKVLRTFLPYKGLIPKARYCAILTIGVDKD
ncbi:hypothetical protein CASFOL_041215 [Castilleja foliolosa]|uniref:F-box domain-containing protein n=1 Tax=Castilleja foliolosa TaxID=1961234 RepID=A0ABD3BE71_9LAMI